MALLFSAVTVTAGYDEAEFTVGGIPREYDDLVGWTAFDDFMENVDAETEVSVHAESYLYGGEETVTATPEEVAYLMMRILLTDNRLHLMQYMCWYLFLHRQYIPFLCNL